MARGCGKSGCARTATERCRTPSSGLVEAGNLENFRLAAGTATGRYRALRDHVQQAVPFLDSDVYASSG